MVSAAAPPQPKSAWRRWFARYGMVVAFVLASALALPSLPYVEFAAPYNKDTWLARGRVPRDWLHVRGHMAYGLVTSRQLIGLTRADVTSLLDPPEPTGKFADWDIVYWVGLDRTASRAGSEWLVMRLDAEGKVTEVRLIDG